MIYKDFKTNELIEAVLYNKHKIKSFIKYRILLRKIKKSTPDYNTFLVIYDFLDQLNFAYFHCLSDENHLFIQNSRKNKREEIKALRYKDDSVDVIITLSDNEDINIVIKRPMGYSQTIINIHNKEADLGNVLDEQLIINITNLIMNELYRMIKKYRKFGRLKRE